MLFNALFTARYYVTCLHRSVELSWFLQYLQLIQCLLLLNCMELHSHSGLPALGLGSVRHSQWSSSTHRGYSRHGTYSIMWQCTTGGAWGRSNPDITALWVVNLVLKGLFSAWNAPHPRLPSSGMNVSAWMTSKRQSWGVVNQIHVHAKVMQKLYHICVFWSLSTLNKIAFWYFT